MVLNSANLNNALSKFTGSRDLGQVGATRVTNPSICEKTLPSLTLAIIRDTNIRSFKSYYIVLKPLSTTANWYESKKL